MPRYIRRDDYECSVVNQRVTVAILTGDVQPGLPQADQMRHCNFAHVCGKFGDPPLLSRFSSAERIGCPYHDNLNTSVKPASSINGSTGTNASAKSARAGDYTIRQRIGVLDK
jgi:hypothetical protein